MKVPAKRALLEHADEQLDVALPELQRWIADTARAAGFGELAPPRFVAHADNSDPGGIGVDPVVRAEIEREAALAIAGPGLYAPARPAPPPQHWPHANIVRRSIAGDDEDATRMKPSTRGFLAAAAASGDSGVPVRSSSDEERFRKGAMRGGGGGRPHDPNIGREQYMLLDRELGRIAAALATRHTRLGEPVPGTMQLAMWCAVEGPGVLRLRRMIDYGAAGRERAERKASGAGAKDKKPKAGPLKPPPAPEARKLGRVPERERVTCEAVSLLLREHGVSLSRKGVREIVNDVDDAVHAACLAKGWVTARPPREKREREAPAWDPAKRLRQRRSA